MKCIAIACALLISTAAAEAREPAFRSATAESVLASCREKAEWQQAFCIGFIEAVAVRLADTRKFCAYRPVNLDPLVEEALEALAEAETDAPAWKIIERRLTLKHLPPCK
jgi:hypothetical protein